MANRREQLRLGLDRLVKKLGFDGVTGLGEALKRDLRQIIRNFSLVAYKEVLGM